MPFATIFALWSTLLVALSVEDPDVTSRQTRADEVRTIATIIESETQRGLLIGPEEDAALLGAVAFTESRIRIVAEGDCRCHTKFGEQLECNAPGIISKVCSSTGTMQVSKGFREFGQYVNTKWRGITLAKLRTPKTNIRAAYEILAAHKKKCGGGPAVWMSAYTMGRCPKSGRPTHRGVRRCVLATAILKRAYGSDDMICGHAGRTTDWRTKRIATRIRNITYTRGMSARTAK